MQSEFTDRSTSNDDFDARVGNFLEDLNEEQKNGSSQRQKKKM